MRRVFFIFVCLLLCGIFHCATTPHTTPAGVAAYEQQTKSALEAVKASNMPARDKAAVVRTMQSGVAITKEQSSEIQRHIKREQALEDMLRHQGEQLAKSNKKAGVLDGLVVAASILGSILLIGVGFLMWRRAKQKVIAAITP